MDLVHQNKVMQDLKDEEMNAIEEWQRGIDDDDDVDTVKKE
jgi:hypothetical protein